jgi:NAD(P)-dependent dehydrogenase (short-subunit alcohol dehydrogenase family)
MDIVIIGVTGGIGSALTELISRDARNRVFALVRATGDSKSGSIQSSDIDFKSEPSLQDTAQSIIRLGGADAVICTVGLLHSATVFPEKLFVRLIPKR